MDQKPVGKNAVACCAFLAVKFAEKKLCACCMVESAEVKAVAPVQLAAQLQWPVSVSVSFVSCSGQLCQWLVRQAHVVQVTAWHCHTGAEE